MPDILSGRADNALRDDFHRPGRLPLRGYSRDDDADGVVMAKQITIYSTPWCGYCRRLKVQLDRVGIGYAEVDIEEHPEAAEFVMSVNNGNQTVPTVTFPDGSALTNPSLAQVRAKIG
jgi:mycoredoxin